MRPSRSLQAHLLHRHADIAHLHFGVEAQLVDARHAERHLSWLGSSRSETRRFDLVVGCDGGGSGMRRALAEGPADFSVESIDLGNHARMLPFDQHLEDLDPHYLYVLAIRPVLAVAGAINGPNGPMDPRWFCQIGFQGSMQFASFEEAAQLFDRAHRCSSLVVDRVALLGDAGAPVPPVGQGVNAAMQGATVLAQCLAEHRGSLDEGLAMYARQWQGECDALRQIAIATYQSQKNSLWRILLASKFGHLGIQLAKDEKLSYRQAWEQSQAGNERPNEGPEQSCRDL